MKRLPLLNGHRPDTTIAYRHGAAISTERFIGHAQALAQSLPEQPQVINLCEDRYNFLLGFAAALIRGQTTLLPPNSAPQGIARLMAEHHDCYPLSDRPDEFAGRPSIACDSPPPAAGVTEIPSITADSTCAILYTSGSSGEPCPHPKSWQMLVDGARLSALQLGLKEGTTLLATVPPQHMFGLESSILLPLQCGCAIDNRRPLFPADIAAALDSLPTPRVLVTTPLQLRACAEVEQTLPECQFILSATAPLSAELAGRIEQLCRTRVKEIYGSTETGALATRITATEQRWSPLPGVELTQQGEGWIATANHLPAPQPLADQLRMSAEGFELLGRSGDLVKVAGKRVSLGELNHALLAIEGVKDGCFFLPEQYDDSAVTRLAAAVVATLSEEVLLERLRQRIDSAFLPRPLLLLDTLPRNDRGKLPREQLLSLLAGHRRRN